jgi:redox-sensing transcriptional repressor
VVRRLSLYLRQLDALRVLGKPTISSRELGDSLRLTDAQVRKDFAYLSALGVAGRGYPVEELATRIRSTLGTDRSWNVVLVGAGNLGRALAAYQGFASKGFLLRGVFDVDAAKAGSSIGDIPIALMSTLPEVVKRESVQLGVIAVPPTSAQDVADQLIDAGVVGLLNFSPVQLSVPQRVSVVSVDLAAQMEQLVFQVSANAARK